MISKYLFNKKIFDNRSQYVKRNIRLEAYLIKQKLPPLYLSIIEDFLKTLKNSEYSKNLLNSLKSIKCCKICKYIIISKKIIAFLYFKALYIFVLSLFLSSYLMVDVLIFHSHFLHRVRCQNRSNISCDWTFETH